MSFLDDLFEKGLIGIVAEKCTDTFVPSCRVCRHVRETIEKGDSELMKIGEDYYNIGGSSVQRSCPYKKDINFTVTTALNCSHFQR